MAKKKAPKAKEAAKAVEVDLRAITNFQRGGSLVRKGDEFTAPIGEASDLVRRRCAVLKESK